MKRYGILIASIMTLAAGSAVAGMNTAAGSLYGLPISWSTTAAQGYGTHAATGGNGASAMCVECHTVNPSALIRQVSDRGAATIDRTNTAYRGSHFVINAPAGGGTNPWNITHSGGGFTGGFGANFREGAQYFRSGNWSNVAWTGAGIAAGARSKYGNGAALVSVYEGDGGATAASADMICESCHNIVANALGADAAGTADNDLLLGSYRDNVDDAICTGCHGQDQTAAGRQQFHSNDNLAAFAGTGTRKRHHVMSGDSLTDTFYGNGQTSTMWAPSASNRLHATWCASPYTNQTTGFVNLDLAAGVAIDFRTACNVAGQGTRAVGDPITLGDIVTVTGANMINCSSCHRPHNAMSSSGAFIFRYGLSGGPDFIGQPAGTGQAAPADLAYGIRRQHDVDSTRATKIYTDYRPLCAGCHYGY